MLTSSHLPQTVWRSVTLLLLCLLLGMTTFASAQEGDPPAEVTPELLVPTDLPSATPSPTATATTAATDLPLPSEMPSITPTQPAEATAEVTAAVTSEATAEVISSATPAYETATPEQRTAPTVEALETRLTERSGKVSVDLLNLEAQVEKGEASAANATAASLQAEVDGSGSRIHIEVVASDAVEAARLRPIFEGLGGVFIIGYAQRLEFYFPVTLLTELSGISGQFVVALPEEGRAALGSYTSEGVSATGAGIWHNRGITGAGVRVGVVDTGFTGYRNRDTSGCVQSAVSFAPGGVLENGDDHGTNVAEIICDMAPGAQVYLAQAYTVSGLNAAVDWLLSQNVQIINMSMRWDQSGAGDGTGEVNSIVQRATDRGVLWVNAAGNSNGDTWHGAYSNTTVNVAGDGLPDGNYHDFGPSSVGVVDYDGVPANVQLQGGAVNLLFDGGRFDCNFSTTIPMHVILRWNDWNATRTGSASGQDYDVYIVRSVDNGATWATASAFSVDNQAGNPLFKPLEEVSRYAVCNLPNTRYGFMVQRWNATGTQYLHAVTWSSGGLATSTSGVSISTPADSLNVLSVAAGGVQPHVQYNGSSYVLGWPFSPSGYPDVEIYSSHGPILGPGGSDPSGATHVKPDLTAPTNVTTSRGQGFNGTSAAAPHAAGFAALVYQYKRAYYDSLNAPTRAAVIINDLKAYFTRPPESNVREDYCEGGTAVYCFGAGVLVTEPPAFLWTDARLEENNTAIILSGPGWGSVSNTLASGRTYTRSTDNFAQVAFRTVFATEVTIAYWQLPDAAFNGMAEIYRNGVLVGSISLSAPTATLATITVPTTDYAFADQFTIRPVGGVGLTLDYIQLGHPDTLQEDNTALNFFGTWRRTALTGGSGGYYTTATTTSSGVSFYSTASQFTVTYAGTPTGGIIEVWVNGRLCANCGEIDTYGGDTRLTRPQEIEQITIPTAEFGMGPYVVELIASGRQNANSRGTGINIDNIRFPTGYLSVAPAVFEAEADMTYGLTLDGSWRNTRSSLASAGYFWSTTTPGAEYRFLASGEQVVVYFTALNTGGKVDIYINGLLCMECGQIDQYASAAMYRTPHAFIIPPGYGTAPYMVKLVNTGSRHPSSRGTSFSVDRVDVLDAGSFDPLALTDIRADDAGIAWLDNGWIMQAQRDAFGGDVFINSTAFRSAYLNTCSRDFTLLTGVGTSGGILKVYGSMNGSAEVLLAEFNSYATSTLWRMTLDVRVPTTAPFDGSCDAVTPYNIRVEVQSWTQNGRPLRYGYLDALLVNDGGAAFGYTYTINDAAFYNSPDGKLVEIGAGWTNAPELTFPFAGSFAAAQGSTVRRTNVAGASAHFVLQGLGNLPRLLHHRTPDGGIAEVWFNGVLAYEIDFYAPFAYNLQTVPLVIPAGTQFPATVEIRNTGRRTRGSAGTYMTIDALVGSGGGPGFAVPLVGTGAQQTELQLFGATWTTSTATPTRTIDPSGGTQATTTQFSGGVRFRLEGASRFLYVTSMSATHGVAEVWVDGRLCAACGTLTSFARSTFWRSPFLITIPTADFGSPPYTVEIRSTNLRPVGGAGYALGADEVVPLDGGAIYGPGDAPFDGSLFSTPVGQFTLGTWTMVNAATALNGSFMRTTDTYDPEAFPIQTPRGIYEFTVPNTQETVILLRNMSTSGGIAHIYIYDALAGGPQLCFECGVIDSYASYARNQVPYAFNIPDRFTPMGDSHKIRIINVPQRAAASRGNLLEIDGFVTP